LALTYHRYKWLAVFVTTSACIFILGFEAFFNFIAAKPGILLNDPVLSLLPASDLSVPIFVLIYSTVIASVWIHRHDRYTILVGLSTYCLVTFTRMATIYLFTLEPPMAWVPLRDPFVSIIAYDPGFAKDLFFSGHTATMCCVIFGEPGKLFKWIKIVVGFVVAFMLLIQHIHYTIDVAAAPLFTYAAYMAIKRFLHIHPQPIPLPHKAQSNSPATS